VRGVGVGCSSGVRPDGEQDDPADPVDLEAVVAQRQLLGRGTGPRVEEPQHVEEGDDERMIVSWNQIGRGPVHLAGPFEGPQQ